MISTIIVIGVVLLIAASVYAHRTDRYKRTLTVVALLLFLLSVGAYAASPAKAANSQGRCTKFVSATFIGPIGTGTCRLVPTKFWHSFSMSAGYNWNFRFGNRDTQKVGDASSRGARDVLLAICGGIAVKSPPAGAVCVGVVGAYWWMLNSTFESATRQGKCTYVQMKSAWPRNYYPTYC